MHKNKEDERSIEETFTLTFRQKQGTSYSFSGGWHSWFKTSPAFFLPEIDLKLTYKQSWKVYFDFFKTKKNMVIKDQEHTTINW